MRAHVVLDAVDEAGRALRLRLDPDVEPDRRVERHLLVHEQVGQLRLEGVEVLIRREVVLGVRPRRDRVDDAVDELADAGLALRRPDVPAEVLADDDVGRELAPRLRDLDVLLLEDGLARFRGDGRGPDLPLDLVVGMDARRGEAARPAQALDLGPVVVQAREARAPRPAEDALAPAWLRPGRLRCLAGARLVGALAGHDRDRSGCRSGHRRPLLVRPVAGLSPYRLPPGSPGPA